MSSKPAKKKVPEKKAAPVKLRYISDAIREVGSVSKDCETSLADGMFALSASIDRFTDMLGKYLFPNVDHEVTDVEVPAIETKTILDDPNMDDV